MGSLNLTKAEAERLLGLMQGAGFEDLRKKVERAGRPIKTQSAKGKARNLQKFTAEGISRITGIPILEDDDTLIKSREMGQSGVDVILRGRARELFPFSVECKSTEQFSIVKTVQQVRKNLLEGTTWMVVYRTKKLRDTMVIIPWEAFEDLMRRGVNDEA